MFYPLNILNGPLRHYHPSFLSPFRPEVYDPVSIFEHIHIVLNDHH